MTATGALLELEMERGTTSGGAASGTRLISTVAPARAGAFGRGLGHDLIWP